MKTTLQELSIIIVSIHFKKFFVERFKYQSLRVRVNFSVFFLSLFVVHIESTVT